MNNETKNKNSTNSTVCTEQHRDQHHQKRHQQRQQKNQQQQATAATTGAAATAAAAAIGEEADCIESGIGEMRGDVSWQFLSFEEFND